MVSVTSSDKRYCHDQNRKLNDVAVLSPLEKRKKRDRTIRSVQTQALDLSYAYSGAPFDAAFQIGGVLQFP